MTLKITPTALTDSFQDYLERVWPNGLYLTTVVDTVVPFDFAGVEFSLEVSAVGIPITFTITRYTNEGLYDQRPPTTISIIPKALIEQVRLPLTSGVNDIQITSDLGSKFFRVGVMGLLTGPFIFTRNLDDHVLTRLQTRQNAILSWTGSLLVERWMRDSDLLPRVNSMHRLGMRLFIDGVSRGGTEIGVSKVAAAITGNNPVVNRVGNITYGFDEVPTVYSTQEDFAGYEHHVWVLDLCAASFVAAGIYLENSPWLWEIQSYGETYIAYSRINDDDEIVTILRNFSDDGGLCSVEDYILTAGCFDRIRPWVRLVANYSFVFCFTQYPFDTSVEVCYALGTVYWDCEILTMEATITDPDYVDPEDPTGDGWVGKPLDGRWDYYFGGAFDTMGSEVLAFIEGESADCEYQKGPVITALMTTRTDSEVIESITVFGTLIINTFDGPILSPV